MATMHVAQWVCALTPSTLPAAVTTAARCSLYNYLGCALAGSTHPTTHRALRATAPLFGTPTSTLLGGPDGHARADAAHAALINGIASHVHDYDDTHLETVIHPTGPVASAALAYAELLDREEGGVLVSGQDLLVALIAGIEAACKLGRAVWPDHYDRGWHITGTTGAIGAGVAVAKLLQLRGLLDARGVAHALGIACAQVTGLREMFGGDTKAFHIGRAAQNGLLAGMLAREGFTSSTRALEAARGWVRVVSASDALQDVVAELGEVWEIEKNAFKPFPCGIVVHPVIDGCVQVSADMKERELRAADIRSVTLRVHPLVLELTGKREPQDGLQAKFSVYHGGAVGLLFGKAGLAEYEDQVVRDERVVSIRGRIIAVADQEVRADEADIVVEMENGAKLHKHVEHAIGSIEVPMTDEQLEAKFIDQVATAFDLGWAQQASHVCLSLSTAASVSESLRSLQKIA